MKDIEIIENYCKEGLEQGWLSQSPRYSDINSPSFKPLRLEKVNLQNANLKGKRFPKVIITNSNFSDADISDAWLGEDAVLTVNNFSNANLSKTLVKCADFSGSNFTGANLSEIMFNSSKFNNTVFRNVNLYRTDLQRMIFSQLDMQNSDFRKTILLLTDFNCSKLNGSNFQNTHLPGVIFTNSDLSNVDFTGATFDGVIFDNTINLRGTIFNDAKFYECSFRGADLRYAQLGNIKADRSTTLAGAKRTLKQKLFGS